MSDDTCFGRRGWSAVGLLIVLELIVVMWPQTTARDGQWRRIQGGEIVGAATLSQAFRITGPNLRSIRFYPRPSRTASGTAHLELTEVRGDDGRVISLI